MHPCPASLVQFFPGKKKHGRLFRPYVVWPMPPAPHRLKERACMVASMFAEAAVPAAEQRHKRLKEVTLGSGA